MTGFESWCAAALDAGAESMVRRARRLGLADHPRRDQIRALARAAAADMRVCIAPETEHRPCEVCGAWFASAGQAALCAACRRSVS